MDTMLINTIVGYGVKTGYVERDLTKFRKTAENV
jgi:hypothetical protein